MSNKIKFYPVGNGDQSLILLKDGTTIAIDCHIRQESVGCTDGTMYDVKKDVLSSIKKRNGIPFLDVFILSHGDKDHCGGYKDHYYQGDPAKYSKEDLEANLIMIDEMWFSPMIAEKHSNPNEEAYQNEAERRLALHLKKSPDKDLPGNRIRIVGYDGNKKYDELNHLRYTPGMIVNTFNTITQPTFSLFIHAPFKETLASADEDPDKNTNSIVFQARFKNHPTDKGFSSLVMLGGDADYIAWELILEKTISSKKDVTESALDWDILLAPHHCSWTFFNEHNCKDEPRDSSLEVLKYRRAGGIVIASCKKIVDDDDNPPSQLAKDTYIKHLESAKKFLNTSTEPKESSPEPIVFLMTENGPVRESNAKVSSASGAAGGAGASSIIIKQG